MQYYKNTKDGIILGIGTEGKGVELTEEQYAYILNVIENQPTPPDGYGYHLRDADLKWELYELPPETEEEDGESL